MRPAHRHPYDGGRAVISPANDTDTVAPFQRLGAVANRNVSGLDMDLVQEMKRHPAELREAAFRLQMDDIQNSLTPRQAELLQFVHDFRRRHDWGPSHQEMMAALGLRSTSRVNCLVSELEDRGIVSRVEGQHRSIRINHAKGA
jgi:predicted transcriptional regulator